MLVVCAALLGLAQTAQASTFSDVPPEHWSYEALDYLQNAGIAAERIAIQAEGKSGALARPGDVERMQLDRRVDASVSTTAH